MISSEYRPRLRVLFQLTKHRRHRRKRTMEKIDKAQKPKSAGRARATDGVEPSGVIRIPPPASLVVPAGTSPTVPKSEDVLANDPGVVKKPDVFDKK